MDILIKKEFIKKCEENLPRLIMVYDICYKLSAHGLLAGGFRISYGEYDGSEYNWNNKPIDLFYEIVDILPKPTTIKDGDFIDKTIYKTNIDDVITDCLKKLNEWHNYKYTILDEIVTKETLFQRELTSLLNRYSKENESNSPDYILANYLINSLNNFNISINLREKWYGR